MTDLTEGGYFVAFLTTAFSSIEDVRRQEPEALSGTANGHDDCTPRAPW